MIRAFALVVLTALLVLTLARMVTSPVSDAICDEYDPACATPYTP